MSAHDGRRRRGAGGTVGLLLLGLVLGIVLAVAVLASGVLDLGSDEPAATQETPGQDPASDGGSASGDVPAPCVRAAEANEVVSQGLDEIAVGVRDQDALAVQEALDAIGDVKPGMDADSAECRELAGQPADDSAEGEGDDPPTEDPGDGEESSTADPGEDEDSPTGEPAEGEPTPTPTP